MSPPIVYLDNNATTRLDERVLEAMLPLMRDAFANASSTHRMGSAVAARVEGAREGVAASIGASPGEIIFTSGGTESDNAALVGVLGARPRKRHVIVSSVEHSAILEKCTALEAEGVEVTRIAVSSAGRLDLDQMRAALRPDTALVSVMLANNETGTIFPLRDVCEIAKSEGVLVHTDAINAMGKIPVDVAALGVDLLSISAHKIHGPKGCGALYVRRGTPFRPLIIGGGQERGRRGGTLNAPGIVGLATACQLAQEAITAEMPRLAALRDAFEARLQDRFENLVIVGRSAPRVGNTSCLCLPGLSAEPLVLLLSEAGVCISSGSACSSGSLDPSHVLRAMGLPPEVAQGQLRFSWSRMSTEADVERVIEVLPGIVDKVGGIGA